jgi:nucleoside-diphosphate-sugar epimerase
MRILITGIKGNVGTALEKHLTKHEVFGIDIIQGVGNNYRVCDVNIASDLFEVVNEFKPELVIHLAAMVSRVTCELSKGITVQTNIMGTMNVIQACKMVNAKLMYFSTSEVYGNITGKFSEHRKDLQPNNFYGLTKLIGEQLVEYEDIRSIIIRPFMMYHENESKGDHRSAMCRFWTDLKAGKKITVHKGSGRSWLHLDDAVEIIEKLFDNEGIVNIGHPEYIYTEQLATMICNRLGLKYGEWVETVEQPAKMTMEKRPCLEKQYDLTNYFPMIDVDEGLSRML